MAKASQSWWLRRALMVKPLGSRISVCVRVCVRVCVCVSSARPSPSRGSVLPSAVQWRVALRYIWAVRGSRHTTRAATQLADHNTTSDAANTPPHTATLVQVGYTRGWTNGSLQARVSKRWPEGQVWGRRELHSVAPGLVPKLNMAIKCCSGMQLDLEKGIT